MKKTTLNDVLNVIAKWAKGKDVIFHGGFIEFGKDKEIVDDRLIGLGDKGTVEISLKEVMKLVKSEKSKFINW